MYKIDVAMPHHHCTMALAALAILGHKSAHSFPIGPVMAEPAKPQNNKIAVQLNIIPRIKDTTWSKPVR